MPERVEPGHAGHEIEADREYAEDGGDEHEALEVQAAVRATST